MDEEPSYERLKESIDNLSASLNKLLGVISDAAEEISDEPKNAIAERLDELIAQNKEIAAGISTLIELHKEHLPRISRHTAINNSAPFPQKPFLRVRRQGVSQPPEHPEQLGFPLKQTPFEPEEMADDNFSLPGIRPNKPELDIGLPEGLSGPSIPLEPKKKRRFL